MRRIFICLVASMLLAIALHFLPEKWDAFYPYEYQGRWIKVFPRGWPITYVFEGEMRDTSWVILLKLLGNVTLITLALLLAGFAWNSIRKWRNKGKA